MHYMMMIYQDLEAPGMTPESVDPDSISPAFIAYIQALQAAGVMVSGNKLAPPSLATTVRVRDGRRQVQDGPFADSKEQLAGYFILDVPDLDAAMAWAARCPAAATGTIELRPTGA